MKNLTKKNQDYAHKEKDKIQIIGDRVSIQADKKFKKDLHGYAPYGIRAGQNSGKAYLSLNAGENTEVLELKNDVEKWGKELALKHEALIRHYLGIGAKETVIWHCGGCYNPAFQTLTLFPHKQWTSFFDENGKNLDLSQLLSDKTYSSIETAMQVTSSTVHFSLYEKPEKPDYVEIATLVADGGVVQDRGESDAKEILYQPFINVREAVVFPSEIKTNPEEEKKARLELKKKETFEKLLTMGQSNLKKRKAANETEVVNGLGNVVNEKERNKDKEKEMEMEDSKLAVEGLKAAAGVFSKKQKKKKTY